MKAAFFDPYLDTLGGGERYTLSFANVLAKNGWNVDIEWGNPAIKEKLETRFGLSLSGIRVVSDINRGDGYDLCFWISDGSIPTLRARKNFLHFQVPFHDVSGKTLLNKMKLFRINKIICNSNFTKSVVDREYGVKSIVVYPPVPTDQIKPKRKENLILSVGRFSQLKQSKRQDILIKAFKKLVDEGVSGWRLVLAGGVEVGVGNLVDELTKMSEGYPIEIIKSPDFNTLKDLYGKAKIFWSASGFGENEEKNPEKVEHFGITLAEAMSAKVIPVVFAAGGHKEIIEDGKNGRLWKSVGNLTQDTTYLINNPRVLTQMSVLAKEASGRFSYEMFEKRVQELIK